MRLLRFYVKAATAQVRVLRAIILRDTRTRFGGAGGSLTYFVAIAIPLLHLLSLMVIPLAFTRTTPLGSNYALFAATGVLPYILCLYPSRMTMLAISDNAALLAFPAVKPPDLIIGRALMEIVVALTVIAIFLIILVAGDVDVWPPDPAEATVAVLVTIYFGVSLGFISAVLLRLSPGWVFVHLLLIIVMYIGSGAFFLARSVPAQIRELMWFNPLFHCVEWLRSAYFVGYGQDMLSKSYVLGFSTVLLLAGLLGERLVRGRLVMS